MPDTRAKLKTDTSRDSAFTHNPVYCYGFKIFEHNLKFASETAYL